MISHNLNSVTFVMSYEMDVFHFFQSITQPNFQYTAAKLCNMLSKEDTIILESGENFRSVFMNRYMKFKIPFMMYKFCYSFKFFDWQGLLVILHVLVTRILKTWMVKE